jgi:hypothetical protein
MAVDTLKSATLATALLALTTAVRADTVVSFDVTPTAAQRAAIQTAAASDFADVQQVAGRKLEYTVAQADLNDDGRPDLLVQYLDAYFCGTGGCSTVLVMATPQGYADKALPLQVLVQPGEKLTVLSTGHKGMRDLRYESAYISHWTGKAYQ